MPSAATHHQPLSTMRWIERAAVLLLSWCTLPSYACQHVKLCDMPVAQSMLVVMLTRIHFQTNTHTYTPAAFTNKQTAFRPQLLHLLTPFNSCNQLTRASSTEGIFRTMPALHSNCQCVSSLQPALLVCHAQRNIISLCRPCDGSNVPVVASCSFVILVHPPLICLPTCQVL